MTPAIAIVGMACRYPDARTPLELWENVLTQRQAFRRLPPERLRLEDYWSADPRAVDTTYATQAAVIEGYEFDRVRFRVAGSTYRAADLAHWLALDVADQALADAGFPHASGLPTRSTGVALGNTLTGEFSRANGLRVRWPYVRRVLEPLLAEAGWGLERRRPFLAELEARFKAPFPPPGDETLAGSLSNTIAGRICNHFDLQGGGYTVDGACAASLLAVATACSALVAGDLDVALAGGVDLSLDPFELVGFARAGALAASEAMYVYDERSAGFWPGEGCGFVVLMRHADALAEGRRIYALIRGWGISSDGTGGLTRPKLEGQLLALDRAYRRAGFGIETVGYFEGHGTGTRVGDTTELRALGQARRAAGVEAPPAAIGSVKANIGHTKAAAGLAGLIKATLALDHQVLPPTSGCLEPHPELRAEGQPPALRVLDRAERWASDQLFRAGVSAMGFGGINTHLVLEGVATSHRAELDLRSTQLARSAQDAELFLLDGASVSDLLKQVDALLVLAPGLAWSDLADLAAALQRQLGDEPVRAALVAARPAELADQLGRLRGWLVAGAAPRLDTRSAVFLGFDLAPGAHPPRVGFLFPGQGSPAHLTGGALRRRFLEIDALYARADLPTDHDGRHTAVAQPAIATASLAGLAVLARLGVQAVVGVGHSLGELVALHWAGAFDEAALRRIAAVRGQAMAALAVDGGGMASIGASAAQVEALLAGLDVVIAGLNAPGQTVLAGPLGKLDRLIERAQARGWSAHRLPVSHAFHSPLVAPAVPALAKKLAVEALQPLARRVVSTVTGAPLAPGADLRALLSSQVTAPVRFQEAATTACQSADLLIEVGPGRVLADLVASFSSLPIVATDAGGPSLRGLLSAAGAAFALGAPLDHAALFADRFTRHFAFQPRRFFVNPCELAPSGDPAVAEAPADGAAEPEPSAAVAPRDAAVPPSELLHRLVAERAELPLEAVQDNSRLLSDLHLNSITVGQLVSDAARRLGRQPPVVLSAYADASVAEVARALEGLPHADPTCVNEEAEGVPSGLDAWVRPFTVELVDCPPSSPASLPRDSAGWRVLHTPPHPLADAIHAQLASVGAGAGTVVCLSPELGECDLKLLLEGAQSVLAAPANARFVVVQHDGGGAAFARTLHLEVPSVSTCVVDVPVDDPRAPAWVAAEATAQLSGGHTEAHYDRAGRRRAPLLRLLPLGEPTTSPPLGPEDVLLVSGGGKGIAAESALALAVHSGARLGLLGRSDPSADAELATHLERLTAAGVRFVYRAADVLDAEAVRVAVGAIEQVLGPVTAILHGAGLNAPQRLATLDLAALAGAIAPKTQGARNLLAAVNTNRLRLFVAFGSIIARSGLWGEAHYGLANEWLTRLVERFQAEHPRCRCLVAEWSVWSDVGMGVRLGSLETLVRQGVTPIPPEMGVAALRQLLAHATPTAVVVTGRYAALSTLRIEQRELPFLRFLERPRVHYPGLELVVEAELSSATDPYLADHVLQGQRLFPAVLGLEAMAQTVMALLQTSTPPTFEDIHFDRPVVVAESGSTTIRLAALVREPGCVEVALRSAETGFQVDHFRAIGRVATPVPESTDSPPADLAPVALDPTRDVYGRLLFHTGRFRRLAGYSWLRATECLAEVAPADASTWFGRYAPPDLVLGDPALRDTAIHAIQACIPHAVLLPTGVDRVWCAAWRPGQAARVWARERAQEGETYVYDVDLIEPDGEVRERWEGLRLRQLASTRVEQAWPAPLLATYVERRVRELIPGRLLGVALEPARGTGRRARSDRAIRRAAGWTVVAQRRPDGKPEIPGLPDLAVSTAHAGELTLGVVTAGQAGCDLQEVRARPAGAWRDLLGAERFQLAGVVAREAADSLNAAATRVWAASESLQKAGAPLDTPLVVRATTADGWVVLGAGPWRVATYVATLDGHPPGHRVALAVLVSRVDQAADGANGHAAGAPKARRSSHAPRSVSRRPAERAATSDAAG